MFILYAILASIFYSLNSVLMTMPYRKLGSLTSVAYRGLSLGITMSFLLLFVEKRYFTEFINSKTLTLLIISSVITCLGNLTHAKAFAITSVGIASSIVRCLYLSMMVIIGVVFFAEDLSLYQSFAIFFLLICIVLIYLLKERKQLNNHVSLEGLLYCFLTAFFFAIGISFFVLLIKESHPFLAGYAWEFLIGIIGYLFFLLRIKITNDTKEKKKLNLRNFGLILLAASPTVLATGCIALALKEGPLSIVSAVTSLSVAFTTLFGYLILKDKISLKQGIIMLLMFIITLTL